MHSAPEGGVGCSGDDQLQQRGGGSPAGDRRRALERVDRGLLAARAEVGYQQRAAAVTEIRRLALDAALAFHRWAIPLGLAPSEGPTQRFYDVGFYEISDAVEALSRYYGVHSVWLGASTRATVEKIVRGLTDYNVRMFETIESDQRHRQEVGKDAMRWHDDKLLKLIADVQTRPRWQRLIGG